MNLREKNLQQTKEQLKEKFTRDLLIIQTIHTIDELNSIINKLFSNLRERYGYYAPRIVREEKDEALLKAISAEKQDDLGVSLRKEDLSSIQELAKELQQLLSLKQKQEDYLEELMKEVCPELYQEATSQIGARLIDLAGSLKHLAELPSSTIQVLGAERALFRHLKTGAKAPKFGVIFAHQKITEAEEKGKAARQLAGKISIAAKKDYFR